MGYSTKEFCRLCDVGRETLRHYENMGFLHPRINPDNQYRSYDEWDASIIAEIKRYQAFGFSLEEIRKILSEHDLAQLISSMENMLPLFQQRIQYYQMLAKKSKEELMLLNMIPKMIGKVSRTRIPDFVFVSENELKQSILSPKEKSPMRSLDFFMPCLCVEHVYSGDEAQEDYSGWGLIAKKEFADYLEAGFGVSVPAEEVVYTIIDAGEKGGISGSLFEPVIKAFREELGVEAITIFSVLLTRTHDQEGRYHRYLYTFGINFPEFDIDRNRYISQESLRNGYLRKASSSNLPAF